MSEGQPIIIKKIVKGGGDGHHGGAWKVAYADFVTAMMAFFLLMWLLNATSEDQRKGLADFFDPSIPISRASAGGAGMLGGEQPLVPPETAGTRDEGERPEKKREQEGEDLGDREAVPDVEAGEFAPKGQPNPATAVPAEGEDNTIGASPVPGEDGEASIAARAAAEAEEEALLGVAADLLSEIGAAGGEGILEYFSMRLTPEGLVIEISDLTGEPLFQSGSTRPAPIMDTLLDILVPVLGTTRNDIAIAGHTDATPFTSRAGYSNWELSADRANIVRRLMTERGLGERRITRVSGRAATDPIDPDPFAPKNRRIALTILRSAP